MSSLNCSKKGRIRNIDVCEGLFDIVTMDGLWEGATEDVLESSDPPLSFFRIPEVGGIPIYNMPFLLHDDFSPWHEANAFLLDSVRHGSVMSRPTDGADRKASRLLDYLMFCEREGIDWLDFSPPRPPRRPTYRYFRYLLDEADISADVLNQRTGVVYSLYKFICDKNLHPIDLDRVDTVETVKLHFYGEFGGYSKDVEKRSQTKASTPTSHVPIGKVRDESEDLRPLYGKELDEFLRIITGREWSAQERLIYQCGLFTGARKQTVLTLRMRHLARFTEENLERDNTYKVFVGPGTGSDTKFDKKQFLYFPRQLAEELLVYAFSPLAKSRRKKLRSIFKTRYPQLKPMSDKDMYVFLSDQGNCYYMAKSDPRYPIVKSRPVGQVSDTLKKKLFKYTSKNFPKDFKHHWLRATYALQYYEWLQPLVESGFVRIGDEIAMVQSRLHHTSRETTENYLKLFKGINERLFSQEIYEDNLLSRPMFDLDSTI